MGIMKNVDSEKVKVVSKNKILNEEFISEMH
jgi:hypothetical protein